MIVRDVRHFLGRARHRAAARAEHALRRAYLALPVGDQHRWTVKRWGFRLTGWLMSDTAAYQRWAMTETRATTTTQRPAPAAIDALVVAADFVLHASGAPVVSIIIPVHGHLRNTLRCLQSISVNPPDRPFEVVVVDDGSPDATAGVLSAVPGLRLLSLPTNEGFIRACNFGARHARGRTLVFLNNDTEVLAGWCDELLDTFDQRPDAGIVGAQLLYPDGALQEAGGIIWRDGSGWNYGRGEDARRPEFNYRRDVDYVSGAALAVPRTLFLRLGGFDEHYLPAYGEDSDLAFKVRELGHSVIYQPFARVVHLEGATGGTDLSQGPKAFQVANAAKLAVRWRTRLDGHETPGVRLSIARERPVAFRVLVMDHCTPEPDKDAGSITTLNLMRLLQRAGGRVTFVPEDNFLFLDRYTPAMQRLGIECLYAPYVTSVDDHLREDGALYDLVLIFRFTAARRRLPSVRRWCPRAAIVLHTSDLHYLRLQRQAALSGDAGLIEQASRMRTAELTVISEVDAAIVHSPVEKALLQSECPAARVHVFEWAIDAPGTRAPFSSRRDIMFLGGFQHPPNVDAALYLVREILPRLRALNPDVVVHLIGSHAPDAVRALQSSSVNVAGFVADLGPYLDRIRVGVAPLRYGAGIKGKVLTAMSHGLPNVITSTAAEGLQLREGIDALVADDPAAFATAVARLYSDEVLWSQVARAGLETVTSRFSLDRGEAIVADILASVHPACVPPAPARPPGAEWTALQNRDSWRCHVESTTASRAAEAAAEAALVPTGRWSTFAVAGECFVCRAPTRFAVSSDYGAVSASGTCIPNWREHLVCTCGLNARTRAVVHAIDEVIAAPADADLYLMEHGSPLHGQLERRFPRLVAAAFVADDVPPGAVVDGVRHEDATRLSFARASLDLIVSCDVLEHIPDYDGALAECSRALRPGGNLLLTAPFVVDSEATTLRARLRRDGSVDHLLSPEYHGDPQRPDRGILCFQHFGWDLLAAMRSAGFSRAEVLQVRSMRFGYPADGIHLIHAIR